MKKLINIIGNSRKKGLIHLMVANIMFAIVAFAAQLFVADYLTEEEFKGVEDNPDLLTWGRIPAPALP